MYPKSPGELFLMWLSFGLIVAAAIPTTGLKSWLIVWSGLGLLLLIAGYIPEFYMRSSRTKRISFHLHTGKAAYGSV